MRRAGGRWRWGVLLVVWAGALVLAPRVLESLPRDDSIARMTATNARSRQELEEFARLFGADEILLVLLRDRHAEPVFRPAAIEAVRSLTTALEAHPLVDEVASLTNLEDFSILRPAEGSAFLRRLGVGPQPGLPRRMLPEDARELDAAEIARLRRDPFLTQGLLGRDARSTALWVVLKEEVRNAPHFLEDVRRLEARLRALAPEDPDLTLHVTGMALLQGTLQESMGRHGLLVTIGSLVVVALTAFLLGVPRLWVLAYLLAWPPLFCALGAVAIALERSLHAFSVNLLPLLVITSGSLLIHTGLEEARGRRRRRGAVLRACLLASVTTALGFGSLVTSPLPALRDFGIEACGATLLAWGGTLTVLLFLPPGRPFRLAPRMRPGRERRRRLSRMWGAAVPLGLATLLALPWPLLAPERLDCLGSFLDYLPPDHALVQDTRTIEAELEALGGLEIVLELPAPARRPPTAGPARLEEVHPLLSDPAFLVALGSFQEQTREKARGRLSSILGPVSLLSYLNVKLVASETGRPPDAADWRPTKEAAAFAWRHLLRRWLALSRQGDFEPRLPSRLVEILGRRMSQVMTPDGRFLRFHARIDAASPQAILALRDELEPWFAEQARELGAKRIYATGSTIAFAEATREVRHAQLRSLFTGGLLISALLLLALRDLVLWLAALFVNAASLGGIATGLWLAQAELSLYTTVMTATVLGVVVDDSLHLLLRVREARGSWRMRLARAVATCGPGIRGTSWALVGGFAIFRLSPLPVFHHLAWSAGAAILFALYWDLGALPRLLAELAPGRRRSAEERAARR